MNNNLNNNIFYRFPSASWLKLASLTSSQVAVIGALSCIFSELDPLNDAGARGI